MSYLVYKLYCKNTSITDVYIGSTKNFVRRKLEHKSRCYNENKIREYNMKVYIFIRENNGWDNWEFDIIEENIEDKVQALVREKYFIEFYNATLNYQNPIRTEEDLKEWFDKNKDKEQERHKEYYQINKEKIKEQVKEYNEKNKDKIKERKNEKITCDICGSISTRSNITRHKKSKKCINTK